jgi:hypothetical protein
MVKKSAVIHTWNSNVHYNIHNSKPLNRILNQMNTIQSLKFYFFTVYSDKVMGWTVEFDSRQEEEFFIHPTASRLAL